MTNLFDKTRTVLFVVCRRLPLRLVPAQPFDTTHHISCSSETIAKNMIALRYN